MSDWRLQAQERFLKGVALHRTRYRPYREGWDHDHCEFCSAKFSQQLGDLNQGYATTDGYRWVCERCYLDFKDAFAWKVCSSTSLPGKDLGEDTQNSGA